MAQPLLSSLGPANPAVDLYAITDDNLIAKKDTYWKYAGD